MLSFEYMSYEGKKEVKSISPPLHTSHFVYIFAYEEGVGCAEKGVGREDGRGCVSDIYLLEFVFQNMIWICFLLDIF